MQEEIRKKIKEELSDNLNGMVKKVLKLKTEKHYYYAKYLEAQDLANFYMVKSEALEKEIDTLRKVKDEYLDVAKDGNGVYES